MKISNVSKFISAGVIAASLAILPSTVSAQTQIQPDTAPNTYQQPTGNVDTARTDNNFDWGWLGLLGLAGLAGLIPKKRHDVDNVYSDRVTRDPDVVTRRGSDYR